MPNCELIASNQPDDGTNLGKEHPQSITIWSPVTSCNHCFLLAVYTEDFNRTLLLIKQHTVLRTAAQNKNGSYFNVISKPAAPFGAECLISVCLLTFVRLICVC